MALTKREEKQLDEDFEKLIRYTGRREAEHRGRVAGGVLKRIKSKLIGMKIRLHIEAKDTKKRPHKRSKRK